LCDGGQLCYITSNKWMRSKYGKPLRKLLLDVVTIEQLIDFGESPIFESATTYTNVMLLTKSVLKGKPKVSDITQIYKPELSLEAMIVERGKQVSYFSDDGFLIVDKIVGEIKEKIESIGVPLKGWNASISYGIKIGLNDAFVIDGKTKNELVSLDPKSIEIIRAVLRGRDIKRYNASFADTWLIDTHNGDGDTPAINIEKYPAVKKHLDKYWDKIGSRQDKGVTPYNLRSCAYHHEFENEKVLWLEMSPVPNFFYESGTTFVLNTAYILTGDSLKYLLAVLNSNVLNFYFPMISTDIRGGTRRYTKQYVEKLPIPRIDESSERIFEQLVDLIQLANHQDDGKYTAIAHFFEELVDACVFELYFSVHMSERNLLFIKDIDKILADSTLKSSKIEQQLETLTKIYQTINAPDHAIRNRLLRLTADSPELLAVIKQEGRV